MIDANDIGPVQTSGACPEQYDGLTVYPAVRVGCAQITSSWPEGWESMNREELKKHIKFENNTDPEPLGEVLAALVPYEKLAGYEQKWKALMKERDVRLTFPERDNRGFLESMKGLEDFKWDSGDLPLQDVLCVTAEERIENARFSAEHTEGAD
ncbi:hypothetical protein FACS1894208_00350 [Clostridia bacterium]|nr:hypothetical protein FACS1894208_00350 [Clostridia bacterium]